jgi:hypothetical protein
LAQANVGAVECRAPHFVATIVALRQEQGWAGGELSQVDLLAGNLNGSAGTTLVAHQLHLSRFCEVVAVRHYYFQSAGTIFSGTFIAASSPRPAGCRR